MGTIGFIGCGNMASSLIGGLLSAKSCEFDSKQVIIFDPSREKVDALVEKFAVRSAKDNKDLVLQADIVVIAVKPQVMQAVLTPLREEFKQALPLIVSVVAGITSTSIENWLQHTYPIVRVMPNTPALVGAGASGLHANERVSEQQRNDTQQLLETVGVTAWTNTEQEIDSVTALSGSGPAYFMLFIQGLVEAATNAGLDETTAQRLAVQTAIGAAELVSQSDEPIQTLIDNVTSPGGTTEQALQAFAKCDFKRNIETAFTAAKRRSEELAQELA